MLHFFFEGFPKASINFLKYTLHFTCHQSWGDIINVFFRVSFGVKSLLVLVIQLNILYVQEDHERFDGSSLTLRYFDFSSCYHIFATKLIHLQFLQEVRIGADVPPECRRERQGEYFVKIGRKVGVLSRSQMWKNWIIFFNCERSSSAIYQINLFVCVFVSLLKFFF